MANDRLPSWNRELAIMDDISAMAREGVMADEKPMANGQVSPQAMKAAKCLALANLGKDDATLLEVAKVIESAYSTVAPPRDEACSVLNCNCQQYTEGCCGHPIGYHHRLAAPPEQCQYCNTPITLDGGLWVTPSLLVGHGAPYCHKSPDHSHHAPPAVSTPRCPVHKTAMVHASRDAGFGVRQGYWKCGEQDCNLFVSEELIESVMQFFQPARPEVAE